MRRARQMCESFNKLNLRWMSQLGYKWIELDGMGLGWLSPVCKTNGRIIQLTSSVNQNTEYLLPQEDLSFP